MGREGRSDSSEERVLGLPGSAANGGTGITGLFSG